MSFQSAILNQQGFGVPGELFTDSPYICKTYTIDSASAAYNLIGSTCCSITSEGLCEAGSGGDLGFAGFLVDPKALALFGTGGQSLTPSLSVLDQTIVECLTMGTIVVQVPAACDIGDLVVYDNTTGSITTIAPAAALPVGKTFANATVAYFTPDAAGSQLAVIQVNPTLVIPQLA